MTALLPQQRGTPHTYRALAYLAWAWAVVFTAFHVYWSLGGRFGLGDAPDLIPAASFDVWTVATGVMFVAGMTVPLAIIHPWGRWIPRWMLLAALWAGCAVLALRGLAGVLDDILRTSGLATNGLTGLTYEQVTGTAHPSATTLWSARAINCYFTLGGLLFGLSALSYQRAPATRWPPR